nr:fructosamine kinase family protein [Lachnospiraceae bacterium]
MTEYHSLDSAIHDIFGSGISVTDRIAVSGGDINRAFRLTLSNGRNVFMKSNSAENFDFFKCEVNGLNAIKSTGTIDTPSVLGLGTDGKVSFLLLSHIESPVKNADFFEDFGHRLAAMHSADTRSLTSGGKFGFFEDNFIGAGYQINTLCESFIDFFRDFRLKPQFERAASYFSKDEKLAIDRFLTHLDKYLI